MRRPFKVVINGQVDTHRHSRIVLADWRREIDAYELLSRTDADRLGYGDNVKITVEVTPAEKAGAA